MDADNGHLGVAAAAKILQLVDVAHRHLAQGGAHQLGADIKGPHQPEAPLFGVDVGGHRLAQVPRPDEDGGGFVVDAQDLPDLPVEQLHIVAIPLLAKAAKAVKVLADLGGCHLHQPGQLLGGDAGDTPPQKLPQKPVVPGQTAND